MIYILLAIATVTQGLYCELSHCTSCIEGSLEICLECAQGYTLSSNNCYKCNDNNCINCKNNIFECNLCKEGYFLAHDNSCSIISSSCLKNCKKCLDSGICGECKEYFTLGIDQICYSMDERMLTNNNNNSNDNSSNIIGTIVGLVIGSILFFFAYWYYRRRRFLRAQIIIATQNMAIINNPAPLVYTQTPMFVNTAPMIPQRIAMPAPPPNYNFQGMSIPPPPANSNQNLIEISQLTFTSAVLLVALDENFTYRGEKYCRICNSEFNPKFDHRALPCGHVFHGECIYRHMIIENKKFCPTDNAPYR